MYLRFKTIMSVQKGPQALVTIHYTVHLHIKNHKGILKSFKQETFWEKSNALLDISIQNHLYLL